MKGGGKHGDSLFRSFLHCFSPPPPKCLCAMEAPEVNWDKQPSHLSAPLLCFPFSIHLSSGSITSMPVSLTKDRHYKKTARNTSNKPKTYVYDFLVVPVTPLLQPGPGPRDIATSPVEFHPSPVRSYRSLGMQNCSSYLKCTSLLLPPPPSQQMKNALVPQPR